MSLNNVYIVYHMRLQLYGRIFLLNTKFTLQPVVDCRLQLQVAKKIPVKPGLYRDFVLIKVLMYLRLGINSASPGFYPKITMEERIYEIF